MPGLSGWELAHAIRQRNETIPIAVITGWGEAVGSDEQKEAFVGLGCYQALPAGTH